MFLKSKLGKLIAAIGYGVMRQLRFVALKQPAARSDQHFLV
jgi:hypothetical protein